MHDKLLSSLLSRPELSKVNAALAAAGGEVYLVGGTVRDVFLEREVRELDLSTNLSADQIEGALSGAGIPNYRINREHQTVLIPSDSDSLPMEITSYRSRTKELGKSIEEDLRLRDFTVNSIAVALGSGQLLDPENGIADVQLRSLKAIGSDFQQRFVEDPLRILRMIRLAVQLGFTIDDPTYLAARQKLDLLNQVSIERVRSEFDKILLSPDPRRGFNLLYGIGFLAELAPEIAQTYGVEQNRFHTEDVFQHTLSVVEFTEPELMLRLAALVHDLGKPGTVSIDEETGDRHFFKHETLSAELAKRLMTRLKYSNQQIDDVCKLAALHMRPVTAGAAGLRRLLRDTDVLFPIWRKLKEADSLACKRPEDEIAAELNVFDANIAEILAGPQVMPLSSLAVDGNDIKQFLGLPESPRIGILLRALHEIVLDDPAKNERESLLATALEMYRRSQPTP